MNRSPGNDSLSSGLPAHDEKKRRSDVVAAVVGYQPTKARPEPVCDLALSSSSEEAGGHRSGGGPVVAEFRANMVRHHQVAGVAVGACPLRSCRSKMVLRRV